LTLTVVWPVTCAIWALAQVDALRRKEADELTPSLTPDQVVRLNGLLTEVESRVNRWLAGD